MHPPVRLLPDSLFERIYIYQSVEESINRKAGSCFDTGLAGYVFTVGYNGVYGDVEAVGNLFVEVSASHFRQDFLLTVAQHIAIALARYRGYE